MNVFVLSTGRCGSETFARACSHMTNFTVTHESNCPSLHPGVKRPYRVLRFPDQHIEVDNRLSWFLGTLEKEYGSDAYYVHLLRRRDEVARSIIDRGEDSIIFSFASGILQHYHRARTLPDAERFEIGLQYWDTVNDNIQLFLRDKPRQITVWLHDIKAPFWRFWTEIGAEGDLNAALEEWDIRHNPRKTVPIGWTSVERGVETAQHQLSTIVPPGRKFILIDDDQDTPIGSLAGRTRIPFLENHGRYWGPPANDDIAVSELGRMRESGVQYIAFTHPGLWWLNYYSRFNAHLRSEYHCAFEGRGLIVFDLDRGAE